MKKTIFSLFLATFLFSYANAQISPEKWHRQNHIENGVLIEKPLSKLPMNCDEYQKFKVKTVASLTTGTVLIFVFSPYIGVGWVALTVINHQRTKEGKGRFINNHKTCKR